MNDLQRTCELMAGDRLELFNGEADLLEAQLIQ